MKPKEFDALIRQKFDQSDFEYNPRNWERLEEQLEGKTKKRSILVWWMMPLMGVAASVAALAIGVNFMWRQAATGNAGVAGFSLNITNEQKLPLHEPQGAAKQYVQAITHTTKPHKNKINNEPVKEEKFGIKLQDALSFNPAKKEQKFNLLDKPVAKKADKKKESIAAVRTFKHEEELNPKGLTIFLSCGVNSGNQNSGFAGGATIRKMVSRNVYIESDVAFVSSNNTPQIAGQYTYLVSGTPNTSRTTKTTNDPPAPPVYNTVNLEIPENYNVKYAQVSPAIGVQILKRISIAAGPDFQQALADTRPSTTSISSISFENVAVTPLFDMGIMGKTEYSISKRVKAQLSYRKGINNVLTPGDKYIDRDYMQMQVRCAIFNK